MTRPLQGRNRRFESARTQTGSDRRTIIYAPLKRILRGCITPLIMTTDNQQGDDEGHEHLEELSDGCGCAELWEHLSEQRAESGSDD